MSDTITKDIDPNRGQPQPESVPEPEPENEPEIKPVTDPGPERDTSDSAALAAEAGARALRRRQIEEDDDYELTLLEESEPRAKSFVCELKADHDERFFQATITTETVDREGDVVIAKGLDFTEFLKNPVVLLGHPFGIDSVFDLPIGRAKWVKAKGRKVIAEITPAPTELGNEVFELVKGGFLNAVSIGFIGIDAGPPTPKELTKRPEWATARRVFRKSQLVEFSIVNVPANPEALISAISKGRLSVRRQTLEGFGLTAPAVRMVRCVDIKRQRLVKRCYEIRPLRINAEDVRRIVRDTAAASRGRMVPA